MKTPWITGLGLIAALSFAADDRPDWTSPVGPDGVTRLIVEAEEMKGLAPGGSGGASPDWRVGSFGGHGQSRTRTAMTDAGDNPAKLTATIEVPSNGTYKLWAKYECPSSSNAAFDVALRQNGLIRREVFRKTYGLRCGEGESVEGYEVALQTGRYRLRITKAASPEPAGIRSIDVLMLTSDPAPLSVSLMLDELRRANHVFMRFRVYPEAPCPARMAWSLAGGEAGGEITSHQFKEPLKPGETSVWMDVGSCLKVENASTFFTEAMAVDPVTGQAVTNPPVFIPFAVDVALAPSDKAVAKTFVASTREGYRRLAILLQPDLKTDEGLAWSRPLGDLYRSLADELNREPRLVEASPARMRFSCTAGAEDPDADPAWAGDAGALFRKALGFNAEPEKGRTGEPESLFKGASAASGLEVELSLGRRKCDVKYGAGERLRLQLDRRADRTPGKRLQDVVGAWGQNAKDVMWGGVQPFGDGVGGGLNLRTAMPLLKVMRRASDMAAATEKWLEPARAVDAPVAVLLSGEDCEARAAHEIAYAALREAGYRVDLISEADARNGYLPRYKALAVCGGIRDAAAADAIAGWVMKGGLRLSPANDAGLAAELAKAGIRPDIRADKAHLVFNRLTGSEGTVVTVVNPGRQQAGVAEAVTVEIDGLTRVGRVWSYAFPRGLESRRNGTVLTIRVPCVDLADAIVIEK